MLAVLYKIPNDNFKNLYSRTFHSEHEMCDWIANASDILCITTEDVDNEAELECIMINWLDCTEPLWELEGIKIWINDQNVSESYTEDGLEVSGYDN